jgi:hypothetical protein
MGCNGPFYICSMECISDVVPNVIISVISRCFVDLVTSSGPKVRETDFARDVDLHQGTSRGREDRRVLSTLLFLERAALAILLFLS